VGLELLLIFYIEVGKLQLFGGEDSVLHQIVYYRLY